MITYTGSKGVPSGYCGGKGEVTPPLHPTFLVFVGILTKYDGKISWPNVVGKFGVFCHKKQNANPINIHSRRNQTVTGDDGF